MGGFITFLLKVPAAREGKVGPSLTALSSIFFTILLAQMPSRHAAVINHEI